VAFETTDFLNRVSRNPSGGPTPSPVEAFLAGAQAGQLGTSDAVNAELLAQTERIREEMKQQGFSAPKPVSPMGGPIRPAQPGAERRAPGEATSLENEIDRFFEDVQKATQGQEVNFPTNRAGLEERVRQAFQQTNEEFQETMARAGTLGAGAGVAGTLGGATVDPLVLATLPFGVSAAAGITRAAAIEAGIATATEIPIQAIAQTRRADVGLPSGVGRAAKNVAAAAIGAGVLAGGVKAAGKGFSKLGEQAQRLKQTARFQAADNEVNAAASITENAEQLRTQNPYADTPTSSRNYQEANRIDAQDLKITGRMPQRTAEAPVRSEELDTEVSSGVSATTREEVRDIAAGEELAQMARQRVRQGSTNAQQNLTRRAVLNEIDDPDQFARTLTKVQQLRREARSVQRLRDEAEGLNKQRAAGKKAQATRKENAIRERVRQDADLREAVSDTDELVPRLAQGDDEFARSVEALRRTVGADADELTPEQVATSIRRGQQEQEVRREQEVEQSRQGHNRALSSAQRNQARQQGEGEQTAEQITQENQQIKDQLRAVLEEIEEEEATPTVLREEGDEEIPLNEALDELDQEEDILREIDGCLGGRSV
jgi:LysM repeat protein